MERPETLQVENRKGRYLRVVHHIITARLSSDLDRQCVWVVRESSLESATTGRIRVGGKSLRQLFGRKAGESEGVFRPYPD